MFTKEAYDSKQNGTRVQGYGNLLFVGRTRQVTQDTAVGGMRNENFAVGEDTHTLRLESELSDLQVAQANPYSWRKTPRVCRLAAQVSKTHRGITKGQAR